MNMKILGIVALCSIAQMTYAGRSFKDWLKTTLPTESVLKERFKSLKLASQFYEFMDKENIIPMFAKKEMSPDEASKKIDTVFENYFEAHKSDLRPEYVQDARESFKEETEQITKPLILGTLFQGPREKMIRVEMRSKKSKL